MCNGFMIDNLDCEDVASFLSSIRDCRGMFAEADGARICFDSAGTGEPVVMIGGFAAGRGYWSKAPECLPGYRIITLDNRGVGDTEYSGQFSMSDMADDVIAVLDALGLEKAHIVGWSMGSHIARNLASRHPGRLIDLTLIGTYLDRPARSQYVLDRMLGLVLDREIPLKVLYMAINAFCFTEESFKRFEAAGRDPPLPKDPDDPVKLMHQLMAIDVSDRERHEPDIHVPTLVIHGDEDIMVPCYEGRKVSDLIPDSRFLLLKGQGHGIPVKAYAESLLEFMSEHPIAGRRRPCGRPRSSPRYPCG